MATSFNCIYCDKSKDFAEQSVEHAIPQFMGGANAPKVFWIDKVCKACNNRLGLFVDALYAKSWLIANTFASAARSLLTAVDDPPLPLVCLGLSKIPDMIVQEDRRAEHWIGPSGETIVWIRPHDDRMESYAGGNPISSRNDPSVAYFFPTTSDVIRWNIGLRSFKNVFSAKAARQILSAKIKSEDGTVHSPTVFGFDEPTIDDEINLNAIRAAMNGYIKNQIALSIQFDHRFMCKLAISTGYSLFGQPYLDCENYELTRQGLWPPRDGPKPEVRGLSALHPNKDNLPAFLGYSSAVAISVIRTKDYWVLCLTVDDKHTSLISLAPSTLNSDIVDPELGYVLLLVPYLKEAAELTLSSLISHRTKVTKHPFLEKIDDRIEQARLFQATWPSMQSS